MKTIKKILGMNGCKFLITVICSILISAALFGSEPGDTARVNRYIRNGLISISLKDKTAEAKAFIDSALQVIEKNRMEPPAPFYLLRAEYFFVKADYRNASDFGSRTIEQSLKEKDEKTHALALIFFGSFCHRTGSFQESIDYYNKGIELAKRKGFKKMVPGAMDGLANVYKTVGDMDLYPEYLRRMIHTSFIEKDTSYITRGLYLLGSLHAEKLRDFRKSDSLLRMCFSISSVSGDKFHMALSQANMGWNFYLAKMFDSAVVCYNRSLKISIPAGMNNYAANAYGNLGNIYRDLNNNTKALDLYNKSIDLASKAEDLYNLQWIYKDLSDLYLKKGDTSDAFNTYVKHKKYSDMYISKNSVEGLSDARLRYETDSHRKEVELLSFRIKNQKLMMYVYTGLTVFAVAIFFLLYRGSKLRARKRISDMNRKISELTQANLRQQMNPHFIFNTLNSIQYYMYQHDKLATNNYLTKFTSLMRKVLENSQHTSVTIKDELEALNLYLELESLRFKERFDFNITVDEEIDPLLFKIPTMLIQPYVENSICHGMMPGETKGMLKIDLKLEIGHITCTIEDNGIGREAAQKRKKAEGANHNSLGTRIVASRLDLVNSLYGTSLKTIYTDLKNSSGEPAGTKVEIHIPIIS